MGAAARALDAVESLAEVAQLLRWDAHAGVVVRAPPSACLKKKKHCLLLCNDDWACAPEMGTRRTLMQPLMVNLSMLDRRLSMIFSHISVSTKTYWNLCHIKCE